MKKLFLISISTFVLLTLSVSAKTFSDVDEEHPNFNAAYYLSEKGIIKGYNDNTFKPDQQITRAELTKMILVGAKVETKNYGTNCFPDVGYLEWFSNYICTAKEAKYIQGYDDGTFKPDQYINKAEALKIIAKTYDWKMEFEETPGAFADTPNDAWYIDYIWYGIERDLFKGFDDESVNLSDYQFEPGQYITRGEVAEILYRYLVITELDKQAFYPELEDIIRKKLDENIADESEKNTISTEELPRLADGEIKIVLSWQAAETLKKNEIKIDLDSHLLITQENQTEEVYFAHKFDEKVDTLLEVKNNNETTTIRKLKSPATYEYFVYNFSGNKSFAEIKAKVEIHDANGLAKVYSAPSGKDKFWKIFELNEMGEIISSNQLGDCKIIKGISKNCSRKL